MLTYVACPYSHPNPLVMEQRFRSVNEYVASLFRMGQFAFSPISMCHPIAVAHQLPTHWQFWEEYDNLMISKCDRLVVLMLPGWRESNGVISEVIQAIKLGKPVEYEYGSHRY